MRLGLVLAIALLAGCAPAKSREQQAVDVAYDYAREQFRETSNPSWWLPPKAVEDHGDYWIVKFGSNPDMTGGGPWVEVRKSDMRAVDAIGFQ